MYVEEEQYIWGHSPWFRIPWGFWTVSPMYTGGHRIAFLNALLESIFVGAPYCLHSFLLRKYCLLSLLNSCLNIQTVDIILPAIYNLSRPLKVSFLLVGLLHISSHYFFLRFHSFIWEREHKQERQREKERESQADSMFSVEPDTRLDSRTLGQDLSWNRESDANRPHHPGTS